MTCKIAALYRFTPIADAAALCAELKPLFAALNLSGTLLVAPEGINGTLAGDAAAIDGLLKILNEKCGLPAEDVKFSYAEVNPFFRLRIRLKKEIITFRQPQADPSKLVGKYVEAKDWNQLMEDPDVLVLDTRNEYETEYGTFEGAVLPGIDKFTQFAEYVRTALKADPKKKVAMFCTGGIRCEKASSFMLAEGFEEVYHLKGGILKYIEEVPPEQSKWQGSCYVFDHRVAVEEGLKPIVERDA